MNRLAAALALVVLATGCERGGPPRNVLLISVDSLRADRLSAYGNERRTSPTLDRLAQEGVLFERAISPTSWTLPSHVTLLSGRDPAQHGTVAKTDRIDDAVPLLQEAFARAGYETGGFYSGPFLHPYFGFGRGFESYASCETIEVDAARPIDAMTSAHEDRTNETVRKAFTEWLDGRRSDRPFFAFVHMWDVHFDYIAPAPWGAAFVRTYSGDLDGRRIADRGFPNRASRADVEHLLALYDGEVLYTDDTIEKLLEALDRAGVLDDTLVVVTADHGEEFKEHGGKTHHRTVFVESVHVPLILWARHGLPRGLRIEPFVALADVAPTILEIVGLPPLPGADGRSLAAAIRGEPLPSRPVRSAMVIPGEENRRTLALREGRRSLILWKKRDHWLRFDVGRDPAERVPVSPTAAERAELERYDAEILALLANRAKDAPADEAAPDAQGDREGDGANRSGEPGQSGRAGALPSDIAKRLRQLGYIE
jgi:arylsulfatase A-like enzyme